MNGFKIDLNLSEMHFYAFKIIANAFKFVGNTF